MSDESEARDVIKAHLLHRYKQKRQELEGKLQPKKGDQPDKDFVSVVSISTADSFREMMKSDIDELTGLIKKNEFLRRVQAALDFAQRKEMPVNVFILDLDGFKKLNDTYGHEKGDIVLVKLAELLKKSVRSYDVVSRLGGDEFGLLQIGTQEGSEIKIASRIDKGLKDSADKIEGLNLLTGSIGVARYSPGDEIISARSLLERVDVAMFNAKGKSGTKVEIWKPGMMMPQNISSRR